jgi:hypothetical protein
VKAKPSKKLLKMKAKASNRGQTEQSSQPELCPLPKPSNFPIEQGLTTLQWGDKKLKQPHHTMKSTRLPRSGSS